MSTQVPVCNLHGVSKYVPPGVSMKDPNNPKPYEGFWKCGIKDCQWRPDRPVPAGQPAPPYAAPQARPQSQAQATAAAAPAGNPRVLLACAAMIAAAARYSGTTASSDTVMGEAATYYHSFLKPTMIGDAPSAEVFGPDALPNDNDIPF